MALAKELEDLIATLPEADRESTRSLLEKYPALRDGYLRQADYDRNLATTKKERQEAEEARKQAENAISKNKTWFDENKPKLEKVQKERDDLFSRSKELEGRVKELTDRAAAGTGATDTDKQVLVDAVMERMKTMPQGLSEEQVAAVVLREANKLADAERKAFVEQTLPASMNYTLTLAEVMMQHRDEFHEPFDRQAFHKYTIDNNRTADDPRKVYDDMVKDRREKAKEEKMREDIRKEVLSSQSVPGSGVSSGLPGTSGTAPDPEGAVVQFMKKSGPAMGTGLSEAAAEAANELRKEGKF